MVLIKNQSEHPYPSTRKKFICYVCLLLIAPAALLCGCFIYANTHAMNTAAENGLNNYVDDFKEVLETHLTFASDIVTMIEDCPDIRTHLKNLKKGEEEIGEELKNLKDTISSPVLYKRFFMQPAISAVTIFYENSLEYYALDNTSVDLALERCTKLYRDCMDLDLPSGQFISPANGSAYAYWVQDFRNIYENHYYGKVIIELNPVPNNILDNVNPGQTRYTYTLNLDQYPNTQYRVYTDQSAVIFSNNNADIGALVYNSVSQELCNSDKLLEQHSDYYIYQEDLEAWNLHLYLTIPKHSVMLASKSLLYTLILILAVILYCFTAAAAVSRLIYPIQQLHSYYQLSLEQPHVKPVFTPSCREVSEVQELIQNRIEEIHILHTECESLQNQLKDYEIKNLQSQINPHFLFNMLDIINWKASTNGSDDISNMVIKLSELLHSNILFNGRQKITIRQELEYIQNYLVLQQISLAVNFQYKINADDEILDLYQIPKLSLQPIAENCIVHGFSNISREGRITISIWEETDGILCKIEDNGCGFNPDSILNQNPDHDSLNLDSRSHHIALKNIADRLSMLYGPRYGIDIKSAPNQGTVVTVHIPFDKVRD